MTYWKQIPFEPCYEVSINGQVRNKQTMHVKSLRMDKYGYMRVTLYPSGKTYSIHKLVLSTFNPTNNGELQVNHLDGNKLNNNLSNLEWVTISEQSLHRERVLYPGKWDGDRNPSSILSVAQAREIKYGIFPNMNNREIGDLYGVSSEVIRRIRSGERWKYI